MPYMRINLCFDMDDHTQRKAYERLMKEGKGKTAAVVAAMNLETGSAEMEERIASRVESLLREQSRATFYELKILKESLSGKTIAKETPALPMETGGDDDEAFDAINAFGG